MSLKTTYKNDKWMGMRKYRITNNEDGTTCLDDVTEYEEEGDIFNADDINATNIEVNRIAQQTESIAKQIEVQENLFSVPLLANKWTAEAPYIQTVRVDGMKSNYKPVPGVIYPDNITKQGKKDLDKSAGFITYIDTQDGSVQVTCKFDKPICDIPLHLKGY